VNRIKDAKARRALWRSECRADAIAWRRGIVGAREAFRKAFPELYAYAPGHDADYARTEARVLAHLAMDDKPGRLAAMYDSGPRRLIAAAKNYPPAC
jgi:hypothetical protein